MYHTQSPFGIPVTADEGMHPSRKFIQIGPRREGNTFASNQYMRIVSDSGQGRWPNFKRCIALEGTPRRSVSCSVYESRPLCCRLYAPGSVACIEARTWAHYEPLDDGYGRS